MKKVMIIALLIVVHGCASIPIPTTYQKNSVTGGYSETQLDENVFTVSFKGNRYTSRERAIDFTLLRSAELTLQHGYQYFVIINAHNYTTNSTYTTPTTLYIDFYSGETTTYGGDTYNISKPSASNTIVCFKEKPKNIFSYNAQFIYKSIMKKYNIKTENSTQL